VDDVQLSELYFTHSQQGFKECIAGSSKKMSTFHVPQYSHVRGIFEVLGSLEDHIKGRIILPPSIEHGEGSAAHQTASSSEVPRLYRNKVSI
jgi:hypothetical protein